MANNKSNGLAKRDSGERAAEVVSVELGETVSRATEFENLREALHNRRNILIRQLRTLNGALGLGVGCTDIIEA